MTDPIERLRHFDPAAPMSPPDPADIRRRGEQIRRRRQRILMAAVAAAVLAVIVPVTVLSGNVSRALLPAAPADPPSVIIGPAIPEGGSTPPTGPTPGPRNPAAEPPPIPADFLLAAGWPDESTAEPGPRSGLTPPQPDLEHPAFDYVACGATLPVPAETDRLRALWSNVEDLRGRQLLTFPDAAAAAVFVGGAADFYRACGVEPPEGDGLTYTWTVVRTEYGGQSVAVSSTPSSAGASAVGVVRMVHLIRLGSAVLIDTTEGEGGGGGPDLPGLTRSRAEVMALAAAPVVAAMCRYTEAGC